MSPTGDWDFSYLQMNKLFISEGAPVAHCSYCLLLYYTSPSGSTLLLPRTITLSSWQRCMICDMTGLNFMQWLVSCKMSQGAHCCATEGRWGRGWKRRGLQMQCGKQIVTAYTWKLRGSKDYDLYSRWAVIPGLDLDWCGPGACVGDQRPAYVHPSEPDLFFPTSP